jgi:hypothetical protein
MCLNIYWPTRAVFIIEGFISGPCWELMYENPNCSDDDVEYRVPGFCPTAGIVNIINAPSWKLDLFLSSSEKVTPTLLGPL